MASRHVLLGSPPPGLLPRGGARGGAGSRAADRTGERRCQAAGPQCSDAERLAPAPTAVEPRGWRMDMPGVVRILSLLLVLLLPGTASALRVSPQDPQAGMR